MSIEVKICGITNRDDALFSLDFGADYLGFILYPKSPRAIAVKVLSKLINSLNCKCRAIGVFVNESRNQVETIAVDCGLYAVQIHGDELSPEYEHFPLPIWRAVKFVSGVWTPLPEKWSAERYVVDSSVSGMYGGTGVAGNWNEAASFVKKYPAMLSGGLTPENVADAIKVARPIGVDTASGVESQPGKKDVRKLEEFFRNAKKEQP